MEPIQQSLFQSLPPSILLQLDMDHSMVKLTGLIDWDLLQVIAQQRRELVITSSRGQQPHYRSLLGAVIVRSLKSCDLRSTEDLCRNYMPARFMCDLQNSQWTPDHDTIWEFEVMLGEQGLKEINKHVLKVAQGEGFLDIRAICADTTAQEAKIPWPNEVGLMGSFARSVGRGVATLGQKAHGFTKKIVSVVKKIKEKVRSHRLFAKSKKERLEVAAQTSDLSKKLMEELHNLLVNTTGQLKGAQKKTADHLAHLYQTMTQLIGQIDYWITTGWVSPNKIISLFQPDLRAIKRGKIGKNIEFGLKWGINQIRGGYVSLFFLENFKAYEGDYAVASVKEHMAVFGNVPSEFGYDRGAWSPPHIDKLKTLGVKRIGIAPRGDQDWLISGACQKRIKPERAQVEGKIATLKHYGFNRPEEKTTNGMRRAAHRAELRFNLTKLFKDCLNVEKAQCASVG